MALSSTTSMLTEAMVISGRSTPQAAARLVEIEPNARRPSIVPTSGDGISYTGSQATVCYSRADVGPPGLLRD